ncbi:MAG: CpsD/CapB family tyrosine-protein kinase [Lachnospiraceae bacterium]|nr:CpsD/CapB family tyrosine-protein kinase [Lachnospiraceae bacterium]
MKQNQQYYRDMAKVENVVIPDAEKLPYLAREAINILRGNIQLSGYDLKTIAITSTYANEGKSSISFWLAKSMASLKKKTLYLDCDIRNSITVSRYNIQQKLIGLSEFLCGQAALLDVIYRTDDEYFDMIFTGALAPNPSELLSSRLFGKMMDYLRGKYDYVIVDVPPLLPVIDGTLVAKQCDGTIMVVECSETDRNEAIKAKRQLEYAGIHVLGAVLNKVGAKGHHYGYGYGKYGYGRYGKYGKYGYGYGYGKYGKDLDEDSDE